MVKEPTKIPLIQQKKTLLVLIEPVLNISTNPQNINLKILAKVIIFFGKITKRYLREI